MFCRAFPKVAKFKKVKIIRRHFQTIRNPEPNPISAPAAPGVVEAFNLKNFSALPQEDHPRVSKEHRVANILQHVKATDGLPYGPSHIEHLVGRATKGRIYQKQGLFPEQSGSVLSTSFPLNLEDNQEKYEVGGIDIAEKTQLILQSPHPVRYVIEREITNSQKGFLSNLPSYHTWIMLFGRSLQSPFSENSDGRYDSLLNDIANASDSGMFSADIHHTIIDIAEQHPSFAAQRSVQYHMGNKYAVLVGDYFAIRCIYHAERTKTNSVMVAITKGVEDFTTCSFGTNLFDVGVGYPFTLSPNATIDDWLKYNKKAYGYFKGGLDAALSLHQNKQSAYSKSIMESFTGNFSAFLRAVSELHELQTNEFTVPSPFLLTSLPAILYQAQNPEAFTAIRKYGYDLDVGHIKELHDIIRENALAMEQTRRLAQILGHETKQTLRKIATDEYYISVFDSMIDAVADAY